METTTKDGLYRDWVSNQLPLNARTLFGMMESLELDLHDIYEQ
jgi:hypothetical protein